MSMHTQYRLFVWMPLGVLVLVAVLVHGAGLQPSSGLVRKGVQVSLAALLYGGVPYAALAVWATWWVGGRSESEIQRMMLRSPVLFAALFSVLATIVGIVVGKPRDFLAVALLGAAVSLGLGYCFVVLAWLGRRALRGRAPVAMPDGREIAEDASRSDRGA